jgi:mRNA interferase MazF
LSALPSSNPLRGEVWTIDLDPTVGREQAGFRPALVVSVDPFNASPRGLVIVAPIAGTVRALPTHVLVGPPEGGLTKLSVIMTEQVRAVSKARLGRRLGVVAPATLERVGDYLRLLFGLP